jgi:RND family efflux transporter MFP subunit
MAKKGDRLLELDDSDLRDRVQTAKVQALAVEAAMTRAAENVRLAEREGEIEVRLAAIDVELAQAELKNLPAAQQKEILELKVERAKLGLERAKGRAKGMVVQAEADLRARTAAAELETGRLRELERELAQCVLTAPMDGMVVYYVPEFSRFGTPAAVVAPGEPVREGQKLLRVTDLSKFVVGTRVHEAQISSIRPGQLVQVRVDAFPEKVFRGKVANVASVASQVDWARADIKVYPVTISIDEPVPGLKPGMSAEVRIGTGERKGVLLVPVKAVLGAGNSRFCFVKEGKGLLERQVVIGATDGSQVEIREGLKEGDQVLTTPPASDESRRDVGVKSR